MTLEDVKVQMDAIAAQCHESNIAFVGIALQMEVNVVPGEERAIEAAQCVTQSLVDDSARFALAFAAREYANALDAK